MKDTRPMERQSSKRDTGIGFWVPVVLAKKFS